MADRRSKEPQGSHPPAEEYAQQLLIDPKYIVSWHNGVQARINAVTGRLAPTVAGAAGLGKGVLDAVATA